MQSMTVFTAIPIASKLRALPRQEKSGFKGVDQMPGCAGSCVGNPLGMSPTLDPKKQDDKCLMTQSANLSDRQQELSKTCEEMQKGGSI